MHTHTAKNSVSRRALLLGVMAAGACASLFTAPSASAAASAVENFVQRRGEEVIAAANAGSSSRFRSLLRRYANVDEIATFVLGNYASQLPSSKRQRYVSLFENWLGRKFKKHASALAGTSFEVTNATGGPHDYVVNGRIHGGQRMPVSFRVRKSGGSYRVRDVNIGGVWLTIQLRSTITQRLRRAGGNFDALFSYLK